MCGSVYMFACHLLGFRGVDSAHDLDESRLLTLLRMALADVDRLYDLIIAENKPAAAENVCAVCGQSIMIH